MGAQKGIIITHRQSTIYDGISSHCFFGQTTQGDFQCCTWTALQMGVPNSMSSFLTMPFHNEEGWEWKKKIWNEMTRSSRMKAVDLVLDMIGFRWRNLVQCSLYLPCNKLENRKINMILAKMSLLYWKAAETMHFVFIALNVDCIPAISAYEP